ncbi:MAG: hypothetical protein JWN76_407 [Chitinophagaceae bacterium]|nr:hypothetical protein [Chitinophagaceae bacterium]
MPTVLITGGTGMIGTALTGLLLQRGYRVIILTRHADDYSADDNSVQYAGWNIDEQRVDKTAIAKADHIIHLAGAGIGDKKWSKTRKLDILQSRIKSSELLLSALKETSHHVKSVISSSAIGWYGKDENKPDNIGFSEDAPAANDFLANVCKTWESSIEPVSEKAIRLVKLRTGIVLSKSGGALEKFKKPLSAGLAVILGGGDQRVSWIQLTDLCRMYLFAIENENIQGIYNAVSPGVTTNKKLVINLAKLLRNNFFIPVHIPGLFLRLAIGEMAAEVLKSVTVSSEKIKAAGFTFLYPGLEAALIQCI